MILHGETLVSEDLLEKHFVCDLAKCKGACCVEGDLGAPLEDEERTILEDIYDQVEPYLSEEGKAELERQGTWILDEEGDYSTPTIGGRECAYAFYDEQAQLKCGIEAAYRAGKTNFYKPVSCHLYPVRLVEMSEFTGLNYDKWSICAPACTLGKSLQVKVYEFLKEPLIRRFGAEWYQDLVDLDKAMHDSSGN